MDTMELNPGIAAVLVGNDQQRADVIAYRHGLSPSPVLLPSP